jgi:ABC-2 type transport system ATP-binding protein
VPNDEPDVEADPDSEAPTLLEASGLGLRSGGKRRPTRWWPPRRRTRQIMMLDDVSFAIRAGEAVGYVDTGDGKTALIDLISGTTAPTAGTIRTCGRRPDLERESIAQQIGVVSGRRSQLWPGLPLDESLRILAGAHGLTDDLWRTRRAELVRRLELSTFIALPADQVSAGPRIRGELAAALLHEPQLLILDEPTLGLNMANKEWLRLFVRAQSQEHGRTVLLISRELADVERICDRVLLVDHGKLRHDGDFHDLIDRAGAQRTLVVDLTEADRILDDVPGAKLIGVEAGGLRQRLSFVPGGVPATRVLADVAARSGIRHLTLEEPDLEDLVRRL